MKSAIAAVVTMLILASGTSMVGATNAPIWFCKMFPIFCSKA